MMARSPTLGWPRGQLRDVNGIVERNIRRDTRKMPAEINRDASDPISANAETPGRDDTEERRKERYDTSVTRYSFRVFLCFPLSLALGDSAIWRILYLGAGARASRQSRRFDKWRMLDMSRLHHDQ